MPCCHVVEWAQAEVRENPNASKPVRKLASIREEDAETGVHSVFREFGLVPKIEVTAVDLGSPTLTHFPVIKISNWMQYLLDHEMLSRQMTGTPNLMKMKEVLGEFWMRFQGICPEHGVFDLANQCILKLDCTIPYYSHSDEGRSLKHQPLWILSIHAAIGRGTQAYISKGKHLAPLHRNAMGMNFVGATWSTQYLFATLLRAVADENPGCLDKLIEIYSQDVRKLALEGLKSKDGVHQVWFIQLGHKGDLPALTRVGALRRNFSHAPKAKASKKPCVGICHQCLAGKEQQAPNGRTTLPLYPFEDLGPNPAWLATIGQEEPWESEPDIFQGVFMGRLPKPSFLKYDLWHVYHLGIAKHFIAGAFVCLVEKLILPGTSVETKLEWLTQRYKEFGTCSWIKEIRRDTLQWPQASACPVGKWNKGSVSTHLMGFLEWFCSRYVAGSTSDELLLAIDLWFETVNLYFVISF